MADIVIKVGNPNYTLTVRRTRYGISVNKNKYSISVNRGTQGVPGPPGPAGGSSVIFPAGEALGAARVVIVDGGEAFLFQPSNPAHQGRAYGITTGAAGMGANATIQIIGEMVHAAFTFSPDNILYVYNNGVIVDTDPDLAVVQIAGISSGTNKMRIDFSISILKA